MDSSSLPNPEASEGSAANVVLHIVSNETRIIPARKFAQMRQAEDVIELARLEAERILSDARLEAKQVREQAYGQGIEQASAAYAEKLVALETERQLVWKHLQEAIAEAVRRCVESLLADAGQHAGLNVRIFALLREVGPQSPILIHVNEASVEEVRNAADRFREELRSAVQIRVTVDNNLSPSDCIVETAFGVVDGRLQTLLQSIFDGTRRALGASVGEGGDQCGAGDGR